MAALPDGEISATALLRRALHAPAKSLHDFDWIVLVDEALPGQATDRQREQTARMARAQADLRAWAAEEGLPQEHIEASAVYAAGSTPADWPWEVTRGLARLVWWGYTFDSFVDQPALRESIKDLATFDRYIDAIIQGISGQAATYRDGIPQECIALRASLAHFVAELPTFWGQAAGTRHLRHRRFRKELAAWIATMAQEARWDFHLSRGRQADILPSIGAYLKNGRRSIGVYAVSAFAAGLEDDPRCAWHRALAAIEAGGRVARITNDIHLFERDAAEQHITLVVLILRDLGFPITGLDAQTSPAVQRALSVCCRHLDRAVMDFGARCPHRATKPLSYVLQHIVALALGIYGAGDRYRE